MPPDSTPLIEVRGLTKRFPLRAGFFSSSKREVHAVTEVDLVVHAGETIGLVGESGCGKTTLMRTIAGQYRPTDGKILFEGKDVLTLTKHQLMDYKRKVQMVCQDPYSSLDPRMTVEDIVAEPLDIHMPHLSKRERQERVAYVLGLVGLRPTDSKRYPHEFSGGQRQRIGIARALAAWPAVILCDEPVSALDVSIQSQILNLLADIQDSFKAAYVFVAHSLHVIRHVSHRVAVMYLGRLVEVGSSELVFTRPLHPYTQALISSVPIPDPAVMRKRERVPLKGEVPSPVNVPSGCPFHTRCPAIMEKCSLERPALARIEENHEVACHRYA